MKDKEAKRNHNRNMKSFTGGKGFIMMNREIIKKLGDAETIYLGTLIGQLDYYEDHKPQQIIDGYFPVTVADVYNKIGYRYGKQDRLKKSLKQRGLIDFKEDSTKYRNNGLYFKIDMEAVKALMQPEPSDAGMVLPDKRFNPRSTKRPTTLPKTVRQTYRKQKGCLAESGKALLYNDTHNDTKNDSPLEKDQPWDAGASVSLLNSLKHEDIPATELKAIEGENIPADYDALDMDQLLLLASQGDSKAGEIWCQRAQPVLGVQCSCKQCTCQ